MNQSGIFLCKENALTQPQGNNVFIHGIAKIKVWVCGTISATNCGYEVN
jgi:hypothetical protein